MKLPCLAAFVAATLAIPLNEKRSALGPSVTVSNGIIRGSVDLFHGVESFTGIPFAQPPIGPLRLKPPQPYAGQYPGGIFNATGPARACPQIVGTNDGPSVPTNDSKVTGSLTARAIGDEEDCLTLNVQRPAGTSADAKLPVIFWIYGGGFTLGSTSMYDGSQMVAHGATGPAKGNPFIFVAVNYRVGAFGFMGGRELQKDGSTNLGLRDQRLGLQWVADNVRAFGGDPCKVTLWGESAGAISVLDHMIINRGRNTYKDKPLFRGAIMHSGTITPAEPVDTEKAQTVYDTVVSRAGCSTANDTLGCLRQAPYQKLVDAANSLPGLFSYRAADLPFLPRPDPADCFFPVSPEVSISRGKYAKVPVIAGDMEDEGTLFSRAQSNITTNDLLVQYLQSYFPVRGKKLIPDLVATYPDDPAAGSPFRTGALNNIYPQYKRLAAILGDFVFTLSRRTFLVDVAETINAWSFLDTHLYGTPTLGTSHGSDISTYFFGTGPPNVVNTYRTAIISFTVHQNPNQIRDLGWPRYRADNHTGRQLLEIGAQDNKVIKDDFRSASFDLLYRTEGQIRI